MSVVAEQNCTTTTHTITNIMAGTLSVAGAASAASLSLGGYAITPTIIGAGSVQSTALVSGTGYTVPANTSVVNFTQTATQAANTVTLPTAVNNQQLEFDNNLGAITALTFSPAVTGWTNGTTLSASSTLRIRYLTVSSAWQVVQSPSAATAAKIETDYTAAGALAITDDLSVVSNASAITMTLANDTKDQHAHTIYQTGAGTVSVTAMIDGTSQTVALSSQGSLKSTLTLRWLASQSSYVVD
jgi:hypothetical protein